VAKKTYSKNQMILSRGIVAYFYFLDGGEFMNRLKKVMAGMVAVIFLSGWTLSCARIGETIRENPRTALGTTVGALGGAVIGGAVFDTASAAVLGGLLGGLAGGVVGRALERKDEDYASTARDYDYWRQRETLVRLEDIDADPARVVPADTVHLIARYALLPRDPDRAIKVTERWEIRHHGRVVGNPTISTERTGGTWSSAVPLTLPRVADDGVYHARVEVEAEGSVDRGTTTFVVR
jgi:hypothetical protein